MLFPEIVILHPAGLLVQEQRLTDFDYNEKSPMNPKGIFDALKNRAGRLFFKPCFNVEKCN